MNGKIKFHSPDGPAFNQGQRWFGTNGKTEVAIISTDRWGDDKWDVEVTYSLASDPTQIWSKDAWNFQVRYTHQADLVV